MKSLHSLLVAVLVAIPVVSFAQTNAPVTRASVRAEIVQLREAGYNPASDHNRYPDNIQATLARIGGASTFATTSYGPSSEGTSASGSRQATPETAGFATIYAHP
ncbi:DUF4148 domain-containing protein [Paraburkholderia sacchari]|uniref:DUF4148 domain-containing protein n=1 Tax=Paraburkholderia sacchari TaxID=159450 RepID=UPI000544360B|nr:DUF4148 domain-containing protein [Paraburkholderia sacchari]NLP63553.1 DUF4148 domain-containing protein [Paraburkholderia sacchari]